MEKPNKIERLKRKLLPCAFEEKLDTIDYERVGEEERFYLKNFGIYNTKLRPERFMLRLRLSGGRIDTERLEALAATVKRERARMILTARAQMEIHDIAPSRIREVYREIKALGFRTWQTLTDNVRGIVTDPFDGESLHGFMSVMPLIEAMEARVLGRCDRMGMLPRKFNVAVTANSEPTVGFFGNDVAFLPARMGEEKGFHLYLGGKHNAAAQNSGLFLLADEVPEVFETIVAYYIDKGSRGTRARTRLFYMIESMGFSRFVEELTRRHPKALRKGGETHLRKSVATDVVVLRDDKRACRVHTRWGEADSETIARTIEISKRTGARIRIGVDQHFYLLGLSESEAEAIAPDKTARVTACAGSRYCPLSLWDIKRDVETLPLESLARHDIRVGFSGCLKGCGRHHHTDIGLVGVRTNIYGKTEPAARVFVGGEYTIRGVPARLLLPSVPKHALRSVIETIVALYEASGESDFEYFSRNLLNRYEEGCATLWIVASHLLQKPIAPPSSGDERKCFDYFKQMGVVREEKEASCLEAAKRLMWEMWHRGD